MSSLFLESFLATTTSGSRGDVVNGDVREVFHVQTGVEDAEITNGERDEGNQEELQEVEEIVVG